MARTSQTPQIAVKISVPPLMIQQLADEIAKRLIEAQVATGPVLGEPAPVSPNLKLVMSESEVPSETAAPARAPEVSPKTNFTKDLMSIVAKFSQNFGTPELVKRLSAAGAGKIRDLDPDAKERFLGALDEANKRKVGA